MNTLVSVITSVYNEEEHISEMISSILNQTYQNWELIIIDDASSDDTWNIISSYDDIRVHAIKNKSNLGLTKNLNTCIGLAKGKYVLRIDGDDIAYPRRIEQQYAFMESHPDIALSGCFMKAFGEENYIADIWTDSDFLRLMLTLNPVVYHPTFIIRKSIIDEYSILYDESLRYAQDYAFQYDVSKHGKLGNLNEVLMKYRIHSKQVSFCKSIEQMKCANITRNRILSDLGVAVEPAELDAWSKYANRDYLHISKNEVDLINKIINRMEMTNRDNGLLPAQAKSYLTNLLHECEKKTEPGKVNNTSLKYLTQKWISLSNKEDIKNYFAREGINEVAIYGMGPLGRALVYSLISAGVKVKYCVDSNYYMMDKEVVPIYGIDMNLETIDLFIVSVLDSSEIVNRIKEKMECKVISIEDFIFSC